MATLDKELAFFGTHRQELLKNHKGKFVVIHGEELCGVYDSVANAYAAAVKRFGTEPFLIKPVLEQDEKYENRALALGLVRATL